MKCSLDQLLGNECGRVVGFTSEAKNISRLLSFGLLPGCPVTVLQNREGFSLLVQARGMKIALDRSEARCIEVIKA